MRPSLFAALAILATACAPTRLPPPLIPVIEIPEAEPFVEIVEAAPPKLTLPTLIEEIGGPCHTYLIWNSSGGDQPIGFMVSESEDDSVLLQITSQHRSYPRLQAFVQAFGQSQPGGSEGVLLVCLKKRVSPEHLPR